MRGIGSFLAQAGLRGAILAAVGLFLILSGVTVAAAPAEGQVFGQIGGFWQAAEDVGDELSEPTPYENWQILVPILINLVVAAVSKTTWSDAARSWTMVGVSIVITAFGMFLQGTIDTTPVDIVAEILKVIVASVAFYYGVFKPTGMNRRIHEATGG